MGNATEFSTALGASKKYTKLGGLLGEARHNFTRRQTAALARVQAGAAGLETLSWLQDQSRAARSLGVSEDAIQAAMQAAAERDTVASDVLGAAVAATPFDATKMRRQLEMVEMLGLASVALAARQQLGLRQAAAVASLRESSSCGGAHAFASAVGEAKSLGLHDAVEVAEKEMRKRLEWASSEIESAAANGSAAKFTSAMEEARALKLDERALAVHERVFDERVTNIMQKVQQAACVGTVAEFETLVTQALHLGVDFQLTDERSELARRCSQAVHKLSTCMRQVCSTTLATGQWGHATAEDIYSMHSSINSISMLGCLTCSGWDDYISASSGSLAPKDSAQIADALKACSSLGIDNWADVGWRVVQSFAAAQHSSSRGLLLQIEIPRDYWGRYCKDLVSSLGPEAEALRDPIASLAAGLGAAHRDLHGHRIFLWPQPFDFGCCGRIQQCEGDGGSCSASNHEEETDDPPQPLSQPRRPDAAKSANVAAVLSRSMLVSVSPGLQPEQLQDLDISLEGIHSIQGLGTWCPSLRTLNANVNQLTGLSGLTGCTCLEELSVRENSLTSLDGLQALQCLRSLRADANQLTSLKGVHGLVSLQELNLSENRIAALKRDELECLAGLETLSLSRNSLRNLGGGTLPLRMLQHLDVSGNRLTRLTGLEGCPNLRTLRAFSNELQVFPALHTNTMLEELYLNENRLSELPNLPWMPHLLSFDLQVCPVFVRLARMFVWRAFQPPPPPPRPRAVSLSHPLGVLTFDLVVVL